MNYEICSSICNLVVSKNLPFISNLCQNLLFSNVSLTYYEDYHYWCFVNQKVESYGPWSDSQTPLTNPVWDSHPDNLEYNRQNQTILNPRGLWSMALRRASSSFFNNLIHSTICQSTHDNIASHCNFSSGTFLIHNSLTLSLSLSVFGC